MNTKKQKSAKKLVPPTDGSGLPVFKTANQLLRFLKQHPYSAIGSFTEPFQKTERTMCDVVYVKYDALSTTEQKRYKTVLGTVSYQLVNTLKHKGELETRLLIPEGSSNEGWYAILPHGELGFGPKNAKYHGLPAGAKVSDIVPGRKVRVRFLDDPEDRIALVLERENFHGFRDVKVMLLDGDARYIVSISMEQIMEVGSMLEISSSLY
jgi:hypothetical protein